MKVKNTYIVAYAGALGGKVKPSTLYELEDGKWAIYAKFYGNSEELLLQYIPEDYARELIETPFELPTHH